MGFYTSFTAGAKRPIIGPHRNSVIVRFLLLLVLAGVVSAQRTPLKTIQLEDHLVYYRVEGEWAITQGDIILGPAADIEAMAQDSKAPAPRAALTLLNSAGTGQTWPNGTIPYVISPSLPDPQRVLDAVAHWNTHTPLRLVPRTNEVDYVQFQLSSGGCSAVVGRSGGQQPVLLSPSSFTCPTGAVIHEIGHAFGLLHEHSRADRNQWMTVVYENIDSTTFPQFSQFPAARDRGYFDYDSIMIYPYYADSPDGSTTLESVPPGIPFGQRGGLSAGDIDGISRAYGIIPAATTITTIPEGLKIIVDGETYTSPRSFDWPANSTHTIEAPGSQLSGPGPQQVRNQFIRWTDGGTQSHTFTANSNQTVVAAEFQEWFPVSVTASGPGTVSLSPSSPDGYYRAGSTVTIRATPNFGAGLFLWTGNDTEYYGFGSAEQTLHMPVREVITLRANFTTQPLTTITSSRPGLEVRVDNVTFLTPVSFNWMPGTQHSVQVNSPQLDFTAASRLIFDGWADGPLTTTRSITAPIASTTYTVNARLQYYLDFIKTGSGFVTASPLADYYEEGSMVTLTATPGFNQTLQYWLGDTAGSAVTQTIRMDRARFALAVFGPALRLRPANAASYSSNPVFEEGGNNVAPLEIVAIFGDNIGPGGGFLGGQIGQDGRLSSQIGNTRILFDGVPAPIVWLADTAATVVVPQEVAGRIFTLISVERNGQQVVFDTATVVDALPGIFTANGSGIGNIAAYNQDGTLNSPQNPAPPGSTVVLYATGAGLMNLTLPNGTLAGLDAARPLLPVSVRVGSETATLDYAGSVFSLVHGALQVNMRVPAGLRSGNYPIALVVGNRRSAPGATIAVK